MFTPTALERKAFVWMQGRMVELLLRHDASRFDRTFGEHLAEEEQWFQDRLGRYRELAVLFYLRDELFHQILPQIKRRLSFAAPREIQVETPPVRGKVDWGRTAIANWRDAPGEPPLTVYTRHRRRHFATPENLLTVLTLVQYRAQVQQLLEVEEARESGIAIVHPLHEVLELIDRELVFPQFTGLVATVTAIVRGNTSPTPDTLEALVAEGLQPGRNSAYNDLLNWRTKLRELRLLDRTVADENQSMLGTDPERDNYLYQLWLFYELADYLQEQGAILEWLPGTTHIRFAWHEGDYELRHEATLNSVWGARSPRARPDFYISRTDRFNVEHNGKRIWQEPGYLLDAKYYRPRASVNAPADPVKRMVADLHLTGERHGILLFAFQGGPDDPSAPMGSDTLYTLTPLHIPTHRVPPDITVKIKRLCPPMEPDAIALSLPWDEILDEAHLSLSQQVPIRCHALFLDELSATAHGTLLSPTQLLTTIGSGFTGDLSDLVICPKPHVAPWRVDIVSLTRDCCQNGELCHIMGMAGIQKPRRLVTLQDIQVAWEGLDGIAEGEREILATQRVQVVARRYADLIQPDLNVHKEAVEALLNIGAKWNSLPLDATLHETLALAHFLETQVRLAKASNYAGPALLYTGVLETLIRETIFKVTGTLRDAKGKKLQSTLGTLCYAYLYKDHNWHLLQKKIVMTGHWKESIIPKTTMTLGDWIDALVPVKALRNQAAHEARISLVELQTLHDGLFGRNQYGVLNGLTLAWQ